MIARSPVSLSFSFSLSFARSRLTLFLKNPFFSFSCPVILPKKLGDRLIDPNTEARGGDVKLVGVDGDDGVDRELPNDVGHRVRSECVNRLIAEIDDEALTSPLVLVRFDADVDGDEGGGDGTGMGGNVQCKGKDVLVPELEENTSDSICKICSFVKIGFPKGNWFSFDIIESYR